MIISILITLAVSGVFALIGFFTGGNVFQWFSISLVMQFIVFFLFNIAMRSYFQLQTNKLEVQRLNALDENRVTVKCAVCGEPHDIVIKVGGVNEFRCEKCKSLNKVEVSISNYQKTEILEGLITEDIVNEIKRKQESE